MAVSETVNVTGELKKKLVVESEVSIPSGINIENEVSVTSETNIESEVSIPSGINADSDIKINPSGININIGNNSSAKLELKSKIERVGEFGEYRYLVIEFPYSEEIMNEINNGKVKLHLYKQSRKKASETHNPYIKWVVPTASFGVGSKHFIGSFSEEYTVTRGSLSIPPVISIGDTTSNLLTMDNTGTTISLKYNLSELAKAMSFVNKNKIVTPSSFVGSTRLDTALDGNKVIGKRLRNSRVALRYKFRLCFQTSLTTETYSEFTDIVTILYTMCTVDNNEVLTVGMQIK